MITKKGDGAVNLSMLALILLAWQLLSNGSNSQSKPSTRPQIGLSDFLNDDTRDMLNCVNKLSNSQCSQEDRTSAIFQMMTNPAVMNLASNLFGGKAQENPGESAPQQENSVHTQNSTTSDPHVNDEGYRFETPSQASQEFFRPIDNIADTEVKHKLYWFYDNWYVK